jgi:DNA-binding NtrC family response regulator
METLVLYFRDEPLREFALADRPLEIGSDGCCDIVVHDPSVAGRALLVQPAGGTVVAYDLARPGRGAGPSPFPFDAPITVGAHHRLVRLSRAPRPALEPTRGTDGPTERLGGYDRAFEPVFLVVGRGADARRRLLGPKAITIGTDRENDLVLADRAVSAMHCRFETSPDGVVVRDLGSRNGTWVAGVLVKTAVLAPGAVIKTGRTELRLVRDGRGAESSERGLVYVSAAMQEVVGEAERLAAYDFPVLVTGESGAGKEGVARLLHDRSPRARGPFVAVNAGSFSPQLVESELFGHEKGAFTGALASHRGAFEQAASGTLFLDEIGELPLALQARLLRVLDGWEVRRVGGEASIPVDVRLVCATHRDLVGMVRAETFREDLYYRIRQEVLRVPSLRERPEDIEVLARHFLRGVESQVGERRLGEGAIGRLLAHSFPGNVRELRNVVRGAALRSAARVIEGEDIDAAIGRLGASRTPYDDDRGLIELLSRHSGNATAAAQALGVPRSTLRDRVKRASQRKPPKGKTSVTE